MSIEYFITVFICLSPGTGVVHHDGPDVFFASCDDEVMKIFTKIIAIRHRRHECSAVLSALPVDECALRSTLLSFSAS